MHIEYRRAASAQAAQGLTAQQPDVLIHRMLSHFQRLFDCLTLDAAMARMNQVRAAMLGADSLIGSLCLAGGRVSPLAAMGGRERVIGSGYSHLSRLRVLCSAGERRS